MFLESNVQNSQQLGWIEVICGSMFSGKTEELIRRLKRAEFAKQKTLIFKPMELLKNLPSHLEKTNNSRQC